MSLDHQTVISHDRLHQLMGETPGLRLLDVRTPAEYETAHIHGAYNVPLDTLGEHAAEIRTHVDAPVVLICQSGTRARRAEEALKAVGMPNLHILDGGINGWIAGGRSVVRGAERISLERQVRIAAGSLVAIGSALALLVAPLFVLLPFFVGSGLVFAGVTDTCAMGMLIARLPYNRSASCDVDAMVQALKTGSPARPGARAAAPAGTCAA